MRFYVESVALRERKEHPPPPHFNTDCPQSEIRVIVGWVVFAVFFGIRSESIFHLG